MIRVRGLHKTYRDETRTIEVLSGADFEAKAGEFIAIRGRSGSGKTTLINIIGGLDRDYVGEVRVADKLLHALPEADLAHYRSATVGFVFQSFHLLPFKNAVETMSNWSKIIDVGVDCQLKSNGTHRMCFFLRYKKEKKYQTITYKQK